MPAATPPLRSIAVGGWGEKGRRRDGKYPRYAKGLWREWGVERIHDPYRIDYLRAHVADMGRAIDDGVDLIGYTWWGPIDVVLASTGELRKRYGFIHLDKHDDGTGDLHRARKDSFYYYQKLIKSNGEGLD